MISLPLLQVISSLDADMALGEHEQLSEDADVTLEFDKDSKADQAAVQKPTGVAAALDARQLVVRGDVVLREIGSNLPVALLPVVAEAAALSSSLVVVAPARSDAVQPEAPEAPEAPAVPEVAAPAAEAPAAVPAITVPSAPDSVVQAAVHEKVTDHTDRKEFVYPSGSYHYYAVSDDSSAGEEEETQIMQTPKDGESRKRRNITRHRKRGVSRVV